MDWPDLHELEVDLTKNTKNTREIHTKSTQTRGKEQDPLAQTLNHTHSTHTQDPTTTKVKIHGSSSKSLGEMELERDRWI